MQENNEQFVEKKSPVSSGVFFYLATVLSVVLHPMLLPSYGYLFFLSKLPEAATYTASFVQSFAVMVFVLTFLLPMFSFVVLKYLNVISSLRMESREERYYPMMLTSAIYLGVLFLFMYQLRLSGVFVLIQAVTTFSLLMVSIITFWWKISAHAVGMGGMLGLLLGYQYRLAETEFILPFLLAVALWGCLLASRLYLKAHTPLQVYVGTFLGIAVALLGIYLVV